MFSRHLQAFSTCVALSALIALLENGLCADDASANTQRKVLAESPADAVGRACLLPNCGTVLSIRHGGFIESAPTIPVQGPIKRNPPFGPINPHVPPINQPSFMVQRQLDIWVIEVQRRDGTVQVIRQSYPVLFQVGDEVLLEGDHVRVPD